jgi:hypothetical protein
MKKGIVRAVTSTLFFANLAFAQGVYWEARTTAPGEKEKMDRFYYMPRMLKMVSGDEGMAVILRLDREVMIMIDRKEKKYHEITFKEMEQMMEGAGAMMDAQMEMMKEQLAQLPEEQRKAVEEMMKSQKKPKGPDFKVSKTGESKTIGGYDCQEYVITEGGERSSTIWATRDAKEFELMRKDMEEFARRMQAIAKQGMQDSPQLPEGIDGFPIVTEWAGGRKSVVTTIEERSTPAAEFEAPAGFAKESFPGMGQ